MEASMNTPSISLSNAYEQINFYQSNPNPNHKPVVTYSNGPTNFAGLFTSPSMTHRAKPRTKPKQKQHQRQKQQEIFMCAQPFYVGEVDHKIEEIGLMAVKEVRYVDDDEWEQMMRENERYSRALQREKAQEVRMEKKAHATARERNQKGQFIAKNKKVKKKNKTLKKDIKKKAKLGKPNLMPQK